MEKLKTYSSRVEKSFIENTYEDVFDKKYFKIIWMDWGEICRLDEVVVEKVWIFDLECNVGFYQVYANDKISDIEIKNVEKSAYMELQNLLNQGFIKERDCFDCFDGEGWEMILYDSRCQIIHKFCGYIYNNKYLNKIVDLVENIIK
ncbi:MAG: hypothetical protein IJD97_00200 [Clostridia bacterium]|nr:hypothetical protein [Clostridia bacterium]